MKILLLGGSGFFGKSFLHYFQERIFPNDPSYTLIMASRNIDNISSLVSPEYINKRVFLERIDVTSCPSIPKSDLVIHAATSTSEKDYIENPIKERVNIINGASNIIRLIDKKTSFMYISSGAIYGKQDSLELEFDENRTCSNQYKDKVKSVYAESKIEAEKIQPPLEKAINALKLLESKNLKEQLDYKLYYSKLTEIVKNYLEEEVSLDALESTTDELINKFELLKDAGKLSLTNDTINNFKGVLETADLVKFAKSNPGVDIALTDKKVLEIGGGRNSFVIMLPIETEKWVADFNLENNVKSIVEGYYTGDFIDIEVNQPNMPLEDVFAAAQIVATYNPELATGDNAMNRNMEVIYNLKNRPTDLFAAKLANTYDRTGATSDGVKLLNFWNSNPEAYGTKDGYVMQENGSMFFEGVDHEARLDSLALGVLPSLIGDNDPNYVSVLDSETGAEDAQKRLKGHKVTQAEVDRQHNTKTFKAFEKSRS